MLGRRPRGNPKNVRMRKIASIGSVLCAGVLAVNADLAEQKKRLEQELRHVPVVELPARAAAVVRSTPAAERSQAAIIAVETIVTRHPSSATTVVAAISKADPESSAAVAAAATRLAPDEAANIAAATRPAPQRASEARALHHREDHSQGGGNGGVGLGPGPNKPGRPVVHDRPISTVLPNGKPRHFPPSPPNRPVNPPRPHKYNKPRPH